MIDSAIIAHYWPHLLHGALLSLKIAAFSCGIGITLGTVLGVLHAGKNSFARFCIATYVTLLRGTPMLIQITFAFFVLPQLGIRLPAFWAATIAIGLNSSAYMSQIIRAGIVAVGQGQIEAAQVLGFTPFQTTRYIVLPQAIRTVFPALGGEFITLIKDSSLASIIGVMELSKEGSYIKNETFDALTVYCIVAIIYLVLTVPLSLFIDFLEKKMRRDATS